MRHDILENIDVGGRKLTPTLITGGLVIFGILPLHIPGYAPVVPAFALMAVYYWTLHRPDLLSVTAIFLLGFLYDLLTGGPMGMQTLILLSACWLTRLGRRFFQIRSFHIVWFGFTVMAASMTILQWLFMSISMGAPISPKTGVFAYFLTIALYPLFGWVFFHVQQVLPRTT